MVNGYQFRLYPTQEQAQTLLRWIGCQRLIYNAKVSEDRYYRRFRKEQLALTGLPIPIDQTYSQYITERTSFLREVPSIVLRNGTAKWMQAYRRYFVKLGNRPTFQKKSGKQSVWLTSELFSFKPEMEPGTGEVTGYKLHVGTRKFPVGEVTFKAHRTFEIPASIHIAIHAGKWFLSFNAQDDTLADFKEEFLLSHYQQYGIEELESMTLGGDRGVAKPLVTSNGEIFDLREVQKQRIQKEYRRKLRWQRKAAKRQKNSRNQKKAYRKMGRYQQYESNVREDFAHQTSHTLVENPNARIYAFEDLKIKNMTQRPKAQQDEQGRWQKNGARAKAGLNKVILASAWGKVVTYTAYKALRAGKIVIQVPPQHSSQECAECGYTDSGNRPTQALFHCLRCGHEQNADYNAAVILKKRGIQWLKEHHEPKAKKSVKLYRSQLGSERSEVTPVENPISRAGGNTNTQGSRKQEPSAARLETPTSAV